MRRHRGLALVQVDDVAALAAVGEREEAVQGSVVLPHDAALRIEGLPLLLREDRLGEVPADRSLVSVVVDRADALVRREEDLVLQNADGAFAHTGGGSGDVRAAHPGPFR